MGAASTWRFALTRAVFWGHIKLLNILACIVNFTRRVPTTDKSRSEKAGLYLALGSWSDVKHFTIRKYVCGSENLRMLYFQSLPDCSWRALKVWDSHIKSYHKFERFLAINLSVGQVTWLYNYTKSPLVSKQLGCRLWADITMGIGNDPGLDKRNSRPVVDR